MDKQIEYISIDKLHPHEDNPRKDLGDISELTESIKANGILQNLTVVPCTGHYYGDYTVIIGHRRLAAAKAAGLTKVPCIITEMDKKEQLATILLENMQRSDLTVYEQAQGIQMMLDLGETVESVAEKTGFSESTIRRRVRLTTLDANAFKASEGRQVTMADYDRLFEIQDKKRRDEALKSIGTNNFNDTLKREIEAEKKEAEKAAFEQALNKIAEKVSDTSEMIAARWVRTVEQAEDAQNDLPEGTQLYYKSIDSYGWAQLYRSMTAEELEAKSNENAQTAARETERAEREKKKALLDDMCARFYELRKDFVRSCSNLKKKHKYIFEFILQYAVTEYGAAFDYEDFQELVGFETPEDEEIKFDFFKEQFDESPERVAFVSAYCMSEDGPRNSYHNYDGRYFINDELNKLYEILERFGYEKSDEENAYCDGTHELFQTEEAE